MQYGGPWLFEEAPCHHVTMSPCLSVQPFCDGSHKDSHLKPVKFSVEQGCDEAWLCGCKQTGDRPYCDASHAAPLVQDAPG